VNQSDFQGVVLPAGHTGSSLFHQVLLAAVTRFPAELGAARLPIQAQAFKRGYQEFLPRFEAERAGSERRVEIARFVVQGTQEALCFARDGKSLPLREYLAEPLPAVALERRLLTGSAGLRPEVPFEGCVYRGREILELTDRLGREQMLTEAARNALRWIVLHAEQCGGTLDLRGQRFAILGAGAELAPTRLLLQAGADVLWIDVTEPSSLLGNPGEFAGTLSYAAAGNDLLGDPAAVGAAIRSFADGQPVHLGLFAYASGASREWRLCASMNAIVASLDPALVASVSMLVSPTTVAHVQPDTAHEAGLRARTRPFWQAALARSRVLASGGYHEKGSIRVARAAVSIQGLSYQAAQYISKLAAAETFAVFGTDLYGTTPRPVTVSANVAGITATRSLQHPLFQAAFIGAPRFGVRIFQPATTRAINGLMILHDLLNPAAAGAAQSSAGTPAEKAAKLLSQQIHGGIYSMPYPLESAIRIAALIGIGRRPSVLLAALKGEKSMPISSSPGVVL
jgi:hypothetical protein